MTCFFFRERDMQEELSQLSRTVRTIEVILEKIREGKIKLTVIFPVS